MRNSSTQRMRLPTALAKASHVVDGLCVLDDGSLKKTQNFWNAGPRKCALALIPGTVWLPHRTGNAFREELGMIQNSCRVRRVSTNFCRSRGYLKYFCVPLSIGFSPEVLGSSESRYSAWVEESCALVTLPQCAPDRSMGV